MGFSKLHKLSVTDRIDLLLANGDIAKIDAELLRQNPQLSASVADSLVENQLSQFSLPFAVVENLVINNVNRLAPMVTEEASVVAACNYAAKLVAKNGGFSVTKLQQRCIIGQIILPVAEHDNANICVQQLYSHQENLINLANAVHPSLLQRGGGVVDLQIKLVAKPNSQQFICIYVYVDTQDAMGANVVNSMLEACANYIEINLQRVTLMSILSNYAEHCLYQATCTLDPAILRSTKYTGIEVAQRIVMATDYANLDIYRATTHNKGIMNGVDAVVLATGNDNRAVAAAIHAYASKDGQYRSLSNWQINQQGSLEGNLVLPLALGIVGGATNLLPLAKVALNMAKVQSVDDLAAVVVAVGLAQNLAALKALVTDGIQKGHMALHARALALMAGANENEIAKVVTKLRKQKIINLTITQQILAELRDETTTNRN